MNEKYELTETTITKALDFAYDKAVNGVKGLDSAQELAQSYMNSDDTLEEQVDSLIRWQNTKAGASGFLAGVGETITIPVTIPANITSVFFVQARMVAAIAHMNGYDLKDDKVKTFIFASLVGSTAIETIKKAGIKVGTEVALKHLTKNISGEDIKSIHKAVIPRLLTKLGSTGAINSSKAIPIIGGVVSGSVDAISTNIIGNIAKTIFMEVEKNNDASSTTSV
jgi:hypothetical protein